MFPIKSYGENLNNKILCMIFSFQMEDILIEKTLTQINKLNKLFKNSKLKLKSYYKITNL